ncbi:MULTISPECIES: hypothetical protein [unclassified Corynebacterium]|uniref:hypothetical protein n=1 Tax=unclassified Corynebacterium TaxID=2624378 RepID=UPI0029CA246B|nr:MULTISPECIES: hypothetical protein [unclassified Corynebacterium]WPF66803.1 hypothetical protein OLX12_03510 [Corynebacterium sp. 22KM0430]WPF69291.1 hypothetical protein OLW90_03505 [Corynebacterium sp. 21KM1197]
MIRWIIRAAALVLSLVCGVLALQSFIFQQEQQPFGTTTALTLRINESTRPKEEVAASLHRMAEEHSVSLLRETSQEDPEGGTAHDIFYFGARPPAAAVALDGDSIQWFSQQSHGSLHPHTELGTTPLSGRYVLSPSPEARAALDAWAPEHQASIEWERPTSPLRLVYAYLIHNGAGNAALATLLALTAALSAWLLGRERGRSLRLLGGVPSQRIHREDALSIAALLAPGFLVGGLACLCWVIAAHGAEQLPLVWGRVLLVQAAAFAAALLVFVLLSVVGRPSVAALAERRIPQGFRRMGLVLHGAALVVALLVVPSTATLALHAHRLAQDHALWEAMKGTVRVSFSDSTALMDSPEGARNVAAALQELSDSGHLRTSLILDSSIAYSREEMDGFQHIIITDEAWLRAFGISLHDLTEVSLPQAAPTFARGWLGKDQQLSLLSRDGTDEAGLRYYLNGSTPVPAMEAGVALGGNTVQATDSLLVVTDSPLSAFSVPGFLLPSLSSGNIVSTEEGALREALTRHGLGPYVYSVDSIAQLSLDQARKFQEESRMYFLTIALILAAIFLSGAQNAALWATRNARRITTHHLAGHPYRSMIGAPLRGDALRATLTVALAGALTFVLRHPDPLILLLSGAAVLALSLAASALFYRASAIQAFRRTVTRPP